MCVCVCVCVCVRGCACVLLMIVTVVIWFCVSSDSLNNPCLVLLPKIALLNGKCVI